MFKKALPETAIKGIVYQFRYLINDKAAYSNLIRINTALFVIIGVCLLKFWLTFYCKSYSQLYYKSYIVGSIFDYYVFTKNALAKFNI